MYIFTRSFYTYLFLFFALVDFIGVPIEQIVFVAA